MLVLARKVGESVMIGDDVSITVLSISGRQITLGIHGPQSVSIHRLEVYERIQAEKKAKADEEIFSEPEAEKSKEDASKEVASSQTNRSTNQGKK